MTDVRGARGFPVRKTAAADSPLLDGLHQDFRRTAPGDDSALRWRSWSGAVHTESNCEYGSQPERFPAWLSPPWATFEDGTFSATIEELVTEIRPRLCGCAFSDAGRRFDMRRLRSFTRAGLAADKALHDPESVRSWFQLWMTVRLITDLEFGHGPTADRVVRLLDRVPALSRSDLELWASASLPGIEVSDRARMASSKWMFGEIPTDQDTIDEILAQVDRWDTRPAIAFGTAQGPFVAMLLRGGMVAGVAPTSGSPFAVALPRSYGERVVRYASYSFHGDALVRCTDVPSADVLAAALALWADGMAATDALDVAHHIVE